MKPGRNDPCPCGSGKKFKTCCQDKLETPATAPEQKIKKASSTVKEPATAKINELVALFKAGQHAEAERQTRLLLTRYPDSGLVWKVLGVFLQSQGKEAIASLQKAVEYLPDDAEAHYNLACAMRDIGRLDDALAHWCRALEIKPDYAEAHNNMGLTLQDVGHLDEAVASYRRALQINPSLAESHSNLLFSLSHSNNVDATILFSEHRRFAELFEAPLRSDWPQLENDRNPQRCLQVGIVSGDLLNHAIASFIEPVLAHLSENPQASLHAYSNHATEDTVSLRLRGYFTHWQPIDGLSDAALAEKIRSDGIDILIDLSGHTAKNRLLTFARKPAPVQASWMGYPGTTGLNAMDYYLADRNFLPPGEFDNQFTEKIVRLPASAPFLPSEDAPPVNALPALSCGYVTFGSFNRLSKLSRSVIALWSQLLRNLPDSRMVLAGMPEEGKYDSLIEWFAQEGVKRERLIFYTRSNMETYLGLHHQVDICLDTFPYNGGTTTLHALWMGVPTLTLAGSTAAGRPGAAILSNVGLDDFIAHNEEDYVQKGLSLAGNLAALSDIRTGLRERFAQSAVGQPAVIAAGVERALRTMWQRWCAELPPESFEVTRDEPVSDELTTINPTLQQSILLEIEQALQQAVAQHQAGQLQIAEELYLAILQLNPAHPDANYNMGVLAVQKNQPADALPYFLAALDADPACGQYWTNYIDALFQAGQQEEAMQTMALARQQGLEGNDVDELEVRLQNATPAAEHPEFTADIPLASSSVSKSNQIKQKKRIKPNKPASHRGGKLGTQEIDTLMALFTGAQYTDAVTLARTMTKRFPQHGFGWKALGAALKLTGRSAEALIPMQKAAVLLPSDAEAHNNLGVLLRDLGRIDEACASYRRTLQINPNHTDAHFNLGRISQIMVNHDKAESSFRRVLQLEPDYAEAHINLGLTLQNTGRLDDAAASYRRALQIKPDYVEAYSNLGVTLFAMDKLDEAEASFRRALQIRPDYAEAYNNLGLTLQNMGRQGEAEACYRRAIQFKPDYTDAYSNMLFCLSHNEDLNTQTLFAEHVRFGEQFETSLRANWPVHSNLRNPERCLQVGIVSGDLFNHAIASFIEPVLSHLNGLPQLSLHAYYNHTTEDAVSQRLQQYFSHWHPIAGLSDTALAEKIRSDGIDILIDLSGHTAKNRLLTFARKPAPVQASWMGYPGTTGLSAMDYYLADSFFLPAGEFDNQFTEKIVQLPANAPFLPYGNAPPVNALPALSTGHVTFGSFNRLNKISRPVVALWSKILRALPDSRMVLGGMPEEGKYDTLIELFAQEGIERERLDFHARSNMDRYLELHHHVDICLDTFPYNGGTTTLHALWMGVPTLTLAGSTAAGRPGTSILGHVGLDDFIAHNAEDFVQKGLSLAGNLAALSDIRTGLRERFAQSAVGQPALIAAGLECALRIMWQRWCACLPPESFEVTRQEITDSLLATDK